MLMPFFYTLNLLLLLSGLLGIRLFSGERKFSLALIQTLLSLSLLAGEYLYLAYHLGAQAVRLVLFSEIVFALIWLSMAQRLRSATIATVGESRPRFLIEIIVGVVVTAVAGYYLVYRSVTEISDAILTFHLYSPIYFSAVFILMTVLYAAWRLEQFWRALNTARRWRVQVSGSRQLPDLRSHGVERLLSAHIPGHCPQASSSPGGAFSFCLGFDVLCSG
jgi:hypothetical protein